MNLSSQVKALHQVQLEYEDTVEQILPFFYDTLNKNQQIRIRQWIKKLSSVINNILWRKNRNLYAKLLLSMLRTKSGLLEPFNKCPPDGSLPKLSIYEIPFNLKSYIETYEREYKLKQEKKSKSKEKFCKTEVNKENLIELNKQNMMYTINDQKSTTKDIEQSTSKQKLSKTFQRKNSISQKRFSLTTEKISLPKKEEKVNVHQVNELLTDTLEFLNDNFQLLMKNHKQKKSEARQISKLRSLILRINEFQEKVCVEKQEIQNSALQETGYQIIQRLFK